MKQEEIAKAGIGLLVKERKMKKIKNRTFLNERIMYYNCLCTENSKRDEN